MFDFLICVPTISILLKCSDSTNNKFYFEVVLWYGVYDSPKFLLTCNKSTKIL